MSTTVILETLSTTLTRALLTGNSTANDWATIEPIKLIADNPPADGLVMLGHKTNVAPNRLFLVPYCEGGLGSQWSFRIFGWRGHGKQESQTPFKMSEIPYFIAEFQCTACNRGGAVDQGLTEAERLCDTITLVQGNLGTGGYINSTGPGTDLVAYLEVNVAGSKWVSFDFKCADLPAVGMNCLWARS